MRILTVVFIVGALLLLPLTSVAETTMITFDDLTTGATVEGLDTLYMGMDLQSTPAGAVVIETFNDPRAYGAPTPVNRTNACLEDENGVRIDFTEYDENGTTAKGFGYPQAAQPFMDWSYEFSFMPGAMPASFAIRVFDFGDYNPTNATSHSVMLTAYDDLDNPLDMDMLSYTTNGATNPTDSDPFGDLLNAAGDACTAELGEPGYFELMVGSATGIARVELTATGQDPKVGFDSIALVACTRTIGYWKNHDWNGMEVMYGDATITEAIGRSDPVDMKPGNGILWNARGNNFSMLLAQWLAAKLNCDGGSCGYNLIDRAEYFLHQEGVLIDDMETWEFPEGDKRARRDAAKLSEALDAFNNGFSCYDDDAEPM